jgi:hypothetical protein
MHKLQLIEDILNIISSTVMINLPLVAKGSTTHPFICNLQFNDFTDEPRKNVAFKIK